MIEKIKDYSDKRIPVYKEGDINDVIGIVHSNQLIGLYNQNICIESIQLQKVVWS